MGLERCRVLCHAYRLGDVYSGYFERHFNLSAVCRAWPATLACALASGRVPRSEFCARLRRPATAPAFAVHLRLGDVLDWPIYKPLSPAYTRPVAYYDRLPLPYPVVTLYGDAHYRERFGASRSLAYRDAVVRALVARGAAVRAPPRRPAGDGASADADFVDLVVATNVSLSFGRFAALARTCRAQCRRTRPTGTGRRPRASRAKRARAT